MLLFQLDIYSDGNKMFSSTNSICAVAVYTEAWIEIYHNDLYGLKGIKFPF